MSFGSPVDSIRVKPITAYMIPSSGWTVLWGGEKMLKNCGTFLFPSWSRDVVKNNTWGSVRRKDFLNSAKVMSENWFSPTVKRETYIICKFIHIKYKLRLLESHCKCPTWKLVVSFIMSVNLLLVLQEYLQPLVKFIYLIFFIILQIWKENLELYSSSS